MYVGETTRGVRDRFASYRYGNPLESDTDNRVKRGITWLLAVGKSVEIWAMQPKTRVPWGDTTLEVPLSKPIEEHLIKLWDPPLNHKNIGWIFAVTKTEVTGG